MKNIAVLAAVGVGKDGYRQILGVCDGTKEVTESWRTFLRHLKERGLRVIRLTTSDKCPGLAEALREFILEAAWQRCTVHFYRNVLKDVPCAKSREVAAKCFESGFEDKSYRRSDSTAFMQSMSEMRTPASD